MNDKPFRREFLLGLAALAGSGCFGKFGATNALYDWNKGVSDNKWLRWLVFLVLIILPVYGLFILADAIVLNTIEFFTGNNPVGGGHAELPEGHTLETAATSDPNVVRHDHKKDGELVQTIFVRRVGDSEMQIMNEKHQVVARATLAADGSIEVYDGEGKLIRRVDPSEQKQMQSMLDAGAKPSRVLEATSRHELA